MIAVKLGEILRDLPLPEGIIERIVDELRVDAKPRRLIAIMIGYGFALTGAYMATHYQRFRSPGLMLGVVALVPALAADGRGKGKAAQRKVSLRVSFSVKEFDPSKLGTIAWCAVERRFGKAAALFCQTSAATRVLADSGKVADIVRVETDDAFLAGAAGIVAPAETVPFEAESLDLVVSLLSLQAMNDIPGVLAQIRRALRPDGLFLGALAGAGTLAELRESLLAAETELHGGASPRVLPFTDVRDAGALLQRAGLALPVADVETVTVRYDSLFGLAADLRAMGETSPLFDRSRRPATRRRVCPGRGHRRTKTG